MAQRLVLALLFSVLVHAWMMGALDRWLPDAESSGHPLIQVELMPPPAPKPLPKRTLHLEEPKPVAKKAIVASEPRQVAGVTPEVPPAPVPEASASAVPEVAKTPEVVAEPVQPVIAEPLPEDVRPEAVEEPLPRVPASVTIDYQIVRKGGVAGMEHHRYQAKEDGSYTLTSLAEAKGLLALALSDLVQKSEGQVTAQGLKPSHYLYQYGKNADKAQKATLDWQSGVLSMEVGGRRQTVELQEGTQDLLSFMYQFMFVPPLREMQISVTNGKKLKVYNYGFEGEETLQLKMGPVRALRIAKTNTDGEEKTEIWLAADYHYLPVKISKTEKDGTVTERIAMNLRLE